MLFLASGGGSALLVLPAPGIALEDKRAVTRALLKSGATIGEINCVRKHLSAIKGGRLAAAAAPAPVVTLAISDVPGDDPAVIASGPTVADPTSFADARAILARYAIVPPPAIAAPARPKPATKRRSPATRVSRGAAIVLVATPQRALVAAAAAAREHGRHPASCWATRIEGEAREVAMVHAAIARQVAAGRLLVGAAPVTLPAVLLSGGETTVTVRGQGRGGRNAEFLLALALALDGHPRIHALAATPTASTAPRTMPGRSIGPDTLARAVAAGIDLGAHLADNDAYGAFKVLGDLVVTGPTLDEC